LSDSFSILETRDTEKPRCVIANTKKGNSVSFMENKVEWHYLPMSDAQFPQALCEVEQE